MLSCMRFAHRIQQQSKNLLLSRSVSIVTRRQNGFSSHISSCSLNRRAFNKQVTVGMQYSACKNVASFSNSSNFSMMTRDNIEQQNGEHGSKLGDSNLNLDEFDIHPQIVKNLQRIGIKSLFPVQYKTFEKFTDGQDVITKSPTGSGKTLAFALPIVNKLAQNTDQFNRRANPKCLVLSPTRELCNQIGGEFAKISGGTGVRNFCIYGGTSYNPQRDAINNGLEVVIGTPGRLMDLLKSGDLSLDEIESVVLDEADEMLNMGFQQDVEQILSYIPVEQDYQMTLWSATVPQWVKKISRQYMKNAELVDLIGDHASAHRIPETIDHQVFLVPREGNKPDLLKSILSSTDGRVLVFVNTKVEADDLSFSLNNSENDGSRMQDNHRHRKNKLMDTLHGGVTQGKREVVLKDFRSGKTRCLVATDVAARGLDVKDVRYVVHWDVPNQKESFVHRSGRVGRAGTSGTNIILADNHREELIRLNDILRAVGISEKVRFPELPRRSVADVLDNQIMVGFPRRLSRVMTRTMNRGEIPEEISELKDCIGQAFDGNFETAVSALIMDKYNLGAAIDGFSPLSGRIGHVTLKCKSKDRYITNNIEEFLKVDLGINSPVGHVFPLKMRGDEGKIFDLPSADASKVMELSPDDFETLKELPPGFFPINNSMRGGRRGGTGGGGRHGGRRHSGGRGGGRSNYGRQGRNSWRGGSHQDQWHGDSGNRGNRGNRGDRGNRGNRGNRGRRGGRDW